MMGRTHFVSGLAAGLAVVAVTHPDVLTAAAGPPVAAACALLPDLDHASSKATHACGDATEAMSWLIRHLPGGKHRWALHSVTAVAGAAVLAGFIDALIHGPWSLVGYVALGYAAHVAGDLMTDRPVRLWWPFSDRPVWGLPGWHATIRYWLFGWVVIGLKLRLTTNGPAERGAVRPALALIATGALLLILRHVTVTGSP
jgi:membrane-bound metal-dependent hydrolase YbcI (DUF457 family)